MLPLEKNNKTKKKYLKSLFVKWEKIKTFQNTEVRATDYSKGSSTNSSTTFHNWGLLARFFFFNCAKLFHCVLLATHRMFTKTATLISVIFRRRSSWNMRNTEVATIQNESPRGPIKAKLDRQNWGFHFLTKKFHVLRQRKKDELFV